MINRILYRLQFHITSHSEISSNPWVPQPLVIWLVIFWVEENIKSEVWLMLGWRAIFDMVFTSIQRYYASWFLELEQDAQLERMRKEQELRKKKEKEDTLTLEQTKDEVKLLFSKFFSRTDHRYYICLYIPPQYSSRSKL